MSQLGKEYEEKDFFISRKFKTFFYSSGVSLSKLNYWKIKFLMKIRKDVSTKIFHTY